MSALARVCKSVEAHARFVTEQVRRARKDAAFRSGLLARWTEFTSAPRPNLTPFRAGQLTRA